MLSDMREQMSFTTAAKLPINPECNRLTLDLIHTGGEIKVRNIRIYTRNMPALEYRSPA